MTATPKENGKGAFGIRAALFGVVAGVWVLGAGCAAQMGDYVTEEALTVQIPVEQPQSLDIPKRFFDEMLPAHFQHKGIGIINDQETFQKMWDLYTIERTALPPSVDFKTYALLFVYDPNYYNLVSIRGVNIWQGIANPMVERTDWKLSIEGNMQMRRIREREGQTLPEPKVNVGFLQVPRHGPGTPGVTAVLVEAAEDPAESLVIPVPEHE